MEIEFSINSCQIKVSELSFKLLCSIKFLKLSIQICLLNTLLYNKTFISNELLESLLILKC